MRLQDSPAASPVPLVPAFAVGAKVTSTIHFTATFVGGVIVGFTSSWQLTLVVFAAVPLIMVIMGFLAKLTVSFESRMAAAYARAGDSANEVRLLSGTAACACASTPAPPPPPADDRQHPHGLRLQRRGDRG